MSLSYCLCFSGVNGTRVKDAATGKRLAMNAGVPVTRGFDEPAPTDRAAGWQRAPTPAPVAVSSSPSPRRRHPSKPRAAATAAAAAAASSPKLRELAPAQLTAKTLKELRMLAKTMAIAEHAIEEARDADEPKDALIALILGATDPAQPKQKQTLDRAQVRRMVRAQLQRDGLNTDVTDRWIDALFD